MSESNPVIESQLNELAELCCRSIREERSELDQRGDALLRAMVMSGYTRSGLNMRTEVESRAKAACMEVAIHRGSELSSMTKLLDEKLEDILRWNSTEPAQNEPPRSARVPPFNER